MAFRIIGTTWSAGWDFSQSYDYRIDAVAAMAKKMANAPEMLLELVTEEEFLARCEQDALDPRF
jgi:hypothetical protein